jgi:hypothetical protein
MGERITLVGEPSLFPAHNTNKGEGVFWQKLDYLHNNPVKAGLCKLPEDYKYSSARFYEKNEKDWVFLTHHEG